MPLVAGDRLGPYQIVSLLGIGGMGEVYRARDTRLDRIVAVKILSAGIDSPAARERFDREARAISSLNCPNICALYDVGNQDGCAYLVMEYVEGETLAKLLSRGPLPIGKVLEYGAQIVDALDRAHRQGVIHRDLKPGNIMITKAGAKLLDFGLAKIRSSAGFASRTIDRTHTLTAQGPLLGTCQYLAPELLEGKEADARCDIFAFGAVLYEMITGCRAFQGNTEAITIANILARDPPPIPAMPESTGSRLPALEHLVRTCLTKDREERRQTAHDLLLELQWLAESEDSQLEIRPPRTAPRATRAWVIAGVALLLALVVAGWILQRRPYQEPRFMKVSILPPEHASFVGSSLPALSPDGRRLAFAATSEGKTQLWVRDLDSLSAWPVAGTESAYNPFWSPQNDAVAFFSGGKLKKVNLRGGPAVVLCDAMLGRGGSWSRNGTIVFAPSTSDVLYRVASVGGSPAPVTSLDGSLGEVSHRWPWFLPDGRHFLYTGRSSDPTKTAIYAADLESKERQRLRTVSSNAVYSPPGFLLFVRERTLMAEAFDAGRLRTSGEPFPIAGQVDSITGNVQGSFTASETGVVAHYSGDAALNSQLTWYDRRGTKLGAIGEPGTYVKPAISPDGATLAVDRLDPQSGTYDVWLYDLARGTPSRLTFDPRQDGYPVWSPDGSHIAFGSNRSGHFDLYQKSVGTSGKEELLVASPADKFPSDWSRDGRYLIYYQIDPKTKYDLWVLPLGGDGKPFPLLASEFNEHRADLSPDGRWLAYTSDETSRDEIYVQSFPALGSKWKISVNGGTRPVWSRDGKELFYIASDRKLMVAAVRAGDRFETGTPRPLFEVRQSVTRFFDVSPDGRRFLLIDPLPEPVTPPVTLLVNWTAAIKHP
ncbi:MAG: protein kinase [Acidobacteriia bacterium]|nr:protein kinase [Terriglobia bacterium]